MNTAPLSIPVFLSGIRYKVTEADGQIIFSCDDGMSDTSMAFEWKGCGWYITSLRDQWESVFADHVVAATKWVEQNYAITYTDGTGVAYWKGPQERVIDLDEGIVECYHKRFEPADINHLASNPEKLAYEISQCRWLEDAIYLAKAVAKNWERFWRSA